MAHIYADEHGPLLSGNVVWELQVVEVATHLAVNLSKDVACFREVELPGVAHGHHLRGDIVLKHHFFEASVVGLFVQNCDDNSWVLNLCSVKHKVANASV